MRKATLLLLILVFALVLLSSCTRSASNDTGAGVIAENKAFPHLSGPTLSGATLDTSTLAGKPFVLSVWATWCGPCAHEQPMLRRLQQSFGDRVGFLGIDYRDDSAAAKAWTEQFGVSYPSLWDPAGRYAKDLGFPFLPDTYVIDASGTIRYAIFGEPAEQQLTGLINGLLSPSGSPPPGTASPGSASPTG